MSPNPPCQAVSETTCAETPILSQPVSLCEVHALQVSLQVVPGLLSRRLAETKSRNEDGTAPLSPEAAHVVSSAVSVSLPETETHASLVYFLANGGRVKIGQSRGLYNRVRSLSLRPDAVLLLLEGGTRLERALHAKFANHRIADSEWFELSPEIVRFIGSKGSGRSLRNAHRSQAQPVANRQLSEVAAVYQRLQQSTGRRRPTSQSLGLVLGVSRSRGQQLRDAVEDQFPELRTPADS